MMTGSTLLSKVNRVYLLILVFTLNACSQALDITQNTGDSRVGELVDYKLGGPTTADAELDAELLDSEMQAGEMQAGEMQAGEMQAGEMQAGEMQAGEMQAGISTGVVSCIPEIEVCDAMDNDCDGQVDEHARAEICNGEDDDCDGQVDEAFADLGQACSTGLGSCVANGIMICSANEANTTCNATAGTPAEESCDQLDNDCDGVIDEWVAGCCVDGTNQPCGSNVGACVQGVRQCVNGEWGACNDTGPSDESCDGADNDCDSRVDEGVLNACGSCGAVPAETCNMMDDDCDGRVDEQVTNACGECGAVPTEVCNMADDDCDGRTDEQVTNACGQCGALPSEQCDNQDNDCDGRTDENLVNGTCDQGIGECRRTGVNRCTAGQYACDASAGPASNEVCDGRDNDCDSRTDENSQGGNLCDELCDGQDNDLDGQVDEGVLNACGECGDLRSEQCNGQDEDCDGQIDEGVLNACGGCGTVPNEVCNSQDDDCDGSTDEGVLNACGACGLVPEELCNNLDDDCDGSVDENFEQVGAPCTIGQGDCQSAGIYLCDQNGLSCHAPAVMGSTEVCNQQDDDCDGLIDENIDFQRDRNNCGSCGNRCSVSSDRCFEGRCVCGFNIDSCGPLEICDGLTCCREGNCFEIP